MLSKIRSFFQQSEVKGCYLTYTPPQDDWSCRFMDTGEEYVVRIGDEFGVTTEVRWDRSTGKVNSASRIFTAA